MAGLNGFDVRDVDIFDAPDLLALFGNENVVRYLGVKQLRTLNDAQDLVQRYVLSSTRWLRVSRADRFEGVVGVEVQGHQATVLIAFMPHARGAGREFSVPLVQYLMTQPDIWRVWSFCHVDNIGVQRVLERMGAEREGRMRKFAIFPNLSDEPQDVYSYAITRQEQHPWVTSR